MVRLLELRLEGLQMTLRMRKARKVLMPTEN